MIVFQASNMCALLLLLALGLGPNSSEALLINTPNLQPSNVVIPPNPAAATTGNRKTHIDDDQRNAVAPLTKTQAIFLNTVTNVQQPGVHLNRNLYGLPGHQTPRLTSQSLREIDWTEVDRRSEEGWWHLYPFGERYFDDVLSPKTAIEKQIDLNFFLPYYGFRFNYTYVYHEGYIAFSTPWYIQPPLTFPTPQWPNQPDPTLIAAFMADQRYQYVGDTKISNVWYRIIERPKDLLGYSNVEKDFVTPSPREQLTNRQPLGVYSYDDPRKYRTAFGRQLRTDNGNLEDPEMLDRITSDIRHGMVGARGWKADYAIVITWERMAYGGAPRVLKTEQYEQAKRWQNTYQMVVATDEIRTYTMFNFANINWTSSATAGAVFGGRGGHQSALFGFNGGNGTGWYGMPYSGEGNSYKLRQYGSTQIAGRWLARVDEMIQYGGCSNESRGLLETSQQYGNMLGGFAMNVSGPCYRESDIIKLQFDEITIDCERIDMVIARCVIPVNKVFKTGLISIKLSVDGGKNYPWWNSFYVLQPGLARRRVNLVNDARETNNNWNIFDARNLTIKWEYQNITADHNAQVDIALYGYWEDVEKHSFKQIGYIAKRHPNNGLLSFDPNTLQFDFEADAEAWRYYRGGVIQVRVSETWLNDRGDGMYWSSPVSFGWFFHRKWEYEYGRQWSMQICQEWFDYDGRRQNFIMELEPKVPCPCSLDQALMDVGRFTSLPECDMEGDHSCYQTIGAKHCVISTFSVWTGAGQMCCYDYDGWLTFSDDYEYNDQYYKLYSAGVPYRAHPWGAFPYKRPPYIPTMSNFYNDLLPYDFCCRWAGHCEFFYWRRQTSSCQMYKPPSLGYLYGGSHITSFDGQKFSFSGKGYYVLSMMKSPRHDLMVQGRLEQPSKAIWDGDVYATVLTGIAAKDNGSSTVQVFARKDFRRWRYKTDVYVDGVRIFFDMPWKKIQTFQGVTIRNPPKNMNQSEIDVMFTTGVGLRIHESNGLLNVIMSLPEIYRQRNSFFDMDDDLNSQDFSSFSSYSNPWELYGAGSEKPSQVIVQQCTSAYRTVGLLGTYNDDARDDLMAPDCTIVSTAYPQSTRDAINVYYNFGEKWRLDRNLHLPMLFQTDIQPIYDPLSFANPRYIPIFDPYRGGNYSIFQEMILPMDQVRVMCQGIPACEFDYLATGRREFGLDTLSYEKSFEEYKKRGEKKLVSCGPLVKGPGVLKNPPGNNYLHGVTVTFTCIPEYFLHGDQQRTCINGKWSDGWWPWCRSRSEEYGLKWMTGILSSVAIVLAITTVFGMFIMYGRERQRKFIRRKYMGSPTTFPAKKTPVPSSRMSERVSADPEPPPIGSSDFQGRATSV